MCCSPHSFSRLANNFFRHVDTNSVQVRHIALISCQVHIRLCTYNPLDNSAPLTSPPPSAYFCTTMARWVHMSRRFHFVLPGIFLHPTMDISRYQSLSPQHSSSVHFDRCKVQVYCFVIFAAPCSLARTQCHCTNICTCSP